MFESLLRRLPWHDGRQGTGYQVIRLAQVAVGNAFAGDSYLIYYPKGAGIPQHADLVPGKRHYRLNIMLKAAARGGEFRALEVLLRLPRMTLFRSDYSHEVTEVQEGYRVMFSIGLAVKDGL